MRQNYCNDMRGAKIHSSLSEGKKLKVDQYNQSDLLVTEEKPCQYMVPDLSQGLFAGGNELWVSDTLSVISNASSFWQLNNQTKCI